MPYKITENSIERISNGDLYLFGSHNFHKYSKDGNPVYPYGKPTNLRKTDWLKQMM